MAGVGILNMTLAARISTPSLANVLILTSRCRASGRAGHNFARSKRSLAASHRNALVIRDCDASQVYIASVLDYIAPVNRIAHRDIGARSRIGIVPINFITRGFLINGNIWLRHKHGR